MKSTLPFCIVLIVLINSRVTAQRTDQAEKAKPQYGFIENKGQIVDQNNDPNPSVKFLLPLPNNNIVLKTEGFSYNTYKTEENGIEYDSANLRLKSGKEPRKKPKYSFHRVDVKFLGANPDVKISVDDISTDYILYHNGSATEQKIYHYGKVIYHDLYPGIDVEFIARASENKPVEYNFIVHPGANIEDIQLEYAGGKECHLKGEQLQITLAHGVLTETIPMSYWQKSKKQESVKYKQLSNTNGRITVGYSGSLKKRKEALIIDPVPSLSWGTYLGGSNQDHAYKVKADNNGNVYFCGSASSTNNIATTNVYQSMHLGGYEGFIQKFNSSGLRVWGTYYGAGGDQMCFDITTDSQGNIYSCGSRGFLTAAIIKLTPSGQLSWEYTVSIGGWFTSLSLDQQGNIYAGGTLEYPEFASIVAETSHQIEPGGGSDYILVKLNASRQLQWATFYGGSASEFEYGRPIEGMLPSVCLDNFDNVYLAGATTSTDNISSFFSYQPSNNGQLDGFIAKFNPDGVRQWATYYGGTGNDEIYEINSDVLGNIWAVGRTTSTASIATADSYQPTLAGSSDAFVAKFNQGGQPEWATYYGGSGTELATSIVADGSGNVYFTGTTNSTSAIATADSFQPTRPGTGDSQMIVKFNSSGQRQWGTYYGGGGWSNGIDFYSSDAIYVTGDAYGNLYFSTPGAHQTTSPGVSSGFLAKISAPCTAPVTLDIVTVPNICAVKFSTNKLPNCLATYAWNFGDGTTSLERNPLHVYATAGTYNTSVRIVFNCPGCQSEVTLTKQVVYSVPTTMMEDVTVQITTDQKDQVISTSASSFSDAWPLSYSNNTLDNKNSFLNGSQGVWRNNASFVYEKERKLSPSTNIATDGTFTLEQFNWKSAELNGVPNWIKANSMTGYSPYSFELENQDVLGVYSGAIYDYGGQLPAANGVNMRQDEMAFTSFEFLDGTVAGNWIFASGSLPTYVDYKIQSGNKNMALVEASLAQLANVVAVDVVTTQTYSSAQPYKKTNYVKNEIVCIKAHPQNPAWSFVVLKTAPLEELWSGRLRVKNVVSTTGTSVFDNTIAHTGEKSLKVTSDITIKQDLLQLDENKSYWINSWVSVNNASVATPVLASNLGIDIIAKLKNGQVISTFTFQPAGPVIEGWQQLKGSFICPLNTAYIEIKFKPGSTGTAWYDDLRLHPEKGNMKGYVYNLNDYRLQAVLDEENFASFFYYDAEGNLYLTKKETVDGVKTLSENISYQVER